MGIKGKVRGIERHVGHDKGADALEVIVHNNLLPAPEKSVMHDKQIALGLTGLADSLMAGIDSHTYFLDIFAVFNLQAIG
jgi:hypothetical protein